jgi:hypothetical protein
MTSALQSHNKFKQLIRPDPAAGFGFESQRAVNRNPQNVATRATGRTAG